LLVVSAKYPLEHFYYGQTVRDNKPEGTLRLLVATSGVTPQTVTAAVERITLPPLAQTPNGAWALVRGNRQLPFLLVQSQMGKAGQIISHYILMPPDVLRAMGGNIRALMSLVHEEIPTHVEDGKKLFPVTLEAPEPETAEQQIDDMLSFMDMTKNRMDVMEKLLAAIVQGVQVIVQDAPQDLKQRVEFIEGILSLLPASVRFAVTFTTHSLPTTDIDAQIRFYEDETPPTGTLIYNWQTGRVTGETPEDEYSRFIMGQLRLDTDVVVQRTRTMTPMAGWRMKQGDKLGDALSYASYRVKLDEALLNGQPVNKEDVSKVLADDPTLNDQMRILYGRHLLNLSLAMNDAESAAPIASLLSRYADFETAAHQQLTEALAANQAEVVYDIVTGWLRQPECKKTDQWIKIAHRSLLAFLGERARARDTEAAASIVEEVLDAGDDLNIERITKPVVEAALPLTSTDATLAENVFLLSAKYMDTTTFSNLMNKMKPFTAQLPMPVRQFWAVLSGAQVNRPITGLLMEAARVFSEKWETMLVVRLGELARQGGRIDLLDESALSAMARVAISPEKSNYTQRLTYIAHRPESQDLQTLGAKAAAYMLQIWLALEDYDELVAQMIQQSTTFYLGDKQADYIRVIEWLFAETPIPSEKLPHILSEINIKGIKSAPLMMASIGALQNRKRSRELDMIAQQVEKSIEAQPPLLQVIPPDAILDLLSYHANHNDIDGAVRVANLVSLASANQREGLAIITRMYKMMSSNQEMRDTALEFLRLYMRQADESKARYALAFCGRELGANVRSALETTYTIKLVMGGLDLPTYARHVQSTVQLLHDTTAVYTAKTVPTIADLSGNFNSMYGTYTREEGLIFTRSLMAMARSLIAIQQQKHSKDLAGLLAGRTNPVGIMDVLRIIAGYCAEGRRQELKILPPALPYPLGSRSRKYLLDELSRASTVLSEAVRALPTNKPVTLQVQEVRAEIASLLHGLDDALARETQRLLATDLQKLLDLIELIGEKGDPKAIEDGSGLARKIDGGNLIR
jgi:hypothetical protein